MSDYCPICGGSLSRYRQSPADNPTYCAQCRQQVAINQEAYFYESEYDPLIPKPQRGSDYGYTDEIYLPDEFKGRH